jgi:ribonuclease BN (tRNA processing enzyme)
MKRLRHAVLAAAVMISFLSPGSAQTPTSATTGLTATILGSSSPQYDPKRAGPSVLIRSGDTTIIVDTGNGAQARLDTVRLPIKDLDGIFFTHQHLDHNEEFIPIFIRALLGGNRFMLAGPPPLARMAETTLEIYKEDIEYRMRRSGRTLADVKGNYAVRELAGGESFMLGNVQIRTAKVNHTIATTAMRFDAGGRSIVVSGDLIYSASLSALAKGADVLIIDSGGTIKTGQAQRPGGGPGRRQGGGDDARGGGGNQRAHVTLEETARMASEAGAKTLVLTHFTPGEIDEAATIAELRKLYSGKIVFGADLMVVG